MNKTIAIYGAQVVIGVIALASGYAKLAGMDVVVQNFEALGLGQGFRMVAGSAEVVAGLCLLMPRGGVLGALLLTTVMVGALGVTIGRVASSVGAPAYAQQFTVSTHQNDAGRPVVVRQRSEWDI